LVSGFISGTLAFFAASLVAFLCLTAGEALAALEESVSTADNSTAEGVVEGNAVAAFALTGSAV
jgi:hypothetical protein